MRLSALFARGRKPLNRSNTDDSRAPPLSTVRLPRLILSKSDEILLKSGVFQKAVHYEDRIIRRKLTSELDLYSVLDGHSGDSCVNYLCEALPRILSEQLEVIEDREEALRVAFQACSLEYEQDVRENRRSCAGAVGIACLVQGSTCVFANVGDCKAFVSTKSGFAVVNELHRASNPKERARVEELGFTIKEVRGVERVEGSLIPTRTFGDVTLKDQKNLHCVQPTPDTYLMIPEENALFGKRCVLMMTDGFYESCTDEAIMDCLGKSLAAGLSEDETVRALGHLAAASHDDVSLLLLVWN